VVRSPAGGRGRSAFLSVQNNSGTDSASSSWDARRFSPRVKWPGREANHSLVKALIVSGSMPPITISFLGVHRDIFIHILIFNVKAIMCKHTKGFIGLMFVIDSRHHLLGVGTDILNVLGEIPEPGSLNWYSNWTTITPPRNCYSISSRESDFVFSKSSRSDQPPPDWHWDLFNSRSVKLR